MICDSNQLLEKLEEGARAPHQLNIADFAACILSNEKI